MASITAGIVLHNPEVNRLKENLEAVISQVNLLVLVDNNSSNLDEILDLVSNYDKLVLIKNFENVGISKALNQIVQKAEIEDCEWVLTLDQDSVVPTNIVSSYLNYIGFENVALMTLPIVDVNNKEFHINNRAEYIYVDKCITSGSFVNVRICKELGYFDEKMFIDLVDFEYCMRVRSKGYKVLKIMNIYLSHRLGEMKVYKFLGKRIQVTNHSENRNYYYSRNQIYVNIKHHVRFGIFKYFLRMPIKLGKIIMFEKRRKLKIKAIFRGIRDGYRMQ